MKRAPTDAPTISIEQAGRLLQLSEGRIRQLIRGGFIPRGPRGRVGLVEGVQGYIAFLRDEARSAPPPAAAKVQDARAREINLRIEQRLRTMIPAADAMAALDLLRELASKELAGLSARVASLAGPAAGLEARRAQGAIDTAHQAATEVVRSGSELPAFREAP